MRLSAAAARKTSDPCPAVLSPLSRDPNFRGGVVGSLALTDVGDLTWLIVAGEGAELCLSDIVGKDVDTSVMGTTGDSVIFPLSGTIGGGVASRLEGTTKGDVAFLFEGEGVSFSCIGHSGKSAGVLSMDRLASFIG